MNGHKLIPVPHRRGGLQATCSCGWKAIGRDSTLRAAGQSYTAHLYAQGLRTKEQIRLAELKADLETRPAAA